jgi:SAM-dependent methyltransferase
MTELVRQWVKKQAQSLQYIDPIVEFGSMQVEGQEVFADMRPFFGGNAYIGVDMRPSTGVDVVDNVESCGFEDRTIGMVLCLETLEHVKHPWTALKEINRILKDGGLLLISVPWNLQIHAYPDDYWRVTPSGLKMLLDEAGFWDTEITTAGPEADPDTVFAIARKWKLL